VRACARACMALCRLCAIEGQGGQDPAEPNESARCVIWRPSASPPAPSAPCSATRARKGALATPTMDDDKYGRCSVCVTPSYTGRRSVVPWEGMRCVPHFHMSAKAPAGEGAARSRVPAQMRQE
jgi:hypothetical protein